MDRRLTKALIIAASALLCLACKPSGGGGGEPAEPEGRITFASSSFAGDIASYSDIFGNAYGGPRVKVDWSIAEGQPTSYELRLSADGLIDDQDPLVKSRHLGDEENVPGLTPRWDDSRGGEAWVFVDELIQELGLADVPRGYRWLGVVAKDEAGRRAVASSALVFDVFSPAESILPPFPVAEGSPAIDSSFWARWYFLEEEADWYIGDKLVWIKYFSGDLYRVPALEGSDAETVIVEDPRYGRGTGELSFREAGSGDMLVLRREGRPDSYLYRAGREKLEVHGVFAANVTGAGARALGSRALSSAAGVSLVLQNCLNAADSIFCSTEAGGAFKVAGLYPDSVYEVQGLATIAGGELVPTESGETAALRFATGLEGGELGTLAVSDSGHRYKASLVYSPYGGPWFFLADGATRRNLYLNIRNQGDVGATQTSVTLRATVPGQASFGAGGAAEFVAAPFWLNQGSSNALRVPVTFSPDIPGLDSGYADILLEVEIGDAVLTGDSALKDRVQLRVFREAGPTVKIERYPPDLEGHDETLQNLKFSVITPEGLVASPVLQTSQEIALPRLAAGQAPYRVVLTCADGNPVTYSICVDGEPVSLSADTSVPIENLGANEPEAPRLLSPATPYTGKLIPGENAYFDVASSR